MTKQEHWEKAYSTKTDVELSWTQAAHTLSLSLISEVCTSGRVIDIGGGNSSLAAELLERGYSVTVVDISQTALRQAQDRLGDLSEKTHWIMADVTAAPDLGVCAVWHDRAVFHFLTEAGDRAAYVSLMERTVVPGGHAVIATFALDGPEKCSGLPVRRYDGATLAAELGARFVLLKSVHETHVTPWGSTQSFQYSVFRRV